MNVKAMLRVNRVCGEVGGQGALLGSWLMYIDWQFLPVTEKQGTGKRIGRSIRWAV